MSFSFIVSLTEVFNFAIVNVKKGKQSWIFGLVCCQSGQLRVGKMILQFQTTQVAQVPLHNQILHQDQVAQQGHQKLQQSQVPQQVLVRQGCHVLVHLVRERQKTRKTRKRKDLHSSYLTSRKQPSWYRKWCTNSTSSSTPAVVRWQKETGINPRKRLHLSLLRRGTWPKWNRCSLVSVDRSNCYPEMSVVCEASDILSAIRWLFCWLNAVPIERKGFVQDFSPCFSIGLNVSFALAVPWICDAADV